MPDTFGSIEYGYGCYFAFNTTKKNNWKGKPVTRKHYSLKEFFKLIEKAIFELNGHFL